MQLTFLGTSCMVPTKDRAQTALVLEHKGEYLLIDSGESVQRQFKIAGMKPSKIRKILITHWHGDHVLGLPGLLQTLSGADYSGTLEIYGPPGIKEKVGLLLQLFEFDNKLDLKVIEVEEGLFFENEDYTLTAAKLDHGVPCNAYSFQLKERRRIDVKKAKKLGLKEGPLLGKLTKGETITVDGKKITPEEVSYVVDGKMVAFVFDTRMNDNAVRLAENADILVCEAVYTNELSKKADEHRHLTAAQAATIADKADAKHLYLSHVSQRYKDKDTLLKEAREVFKKTELAHDFLQIDI